MAEPSLLPLPLRDIHGIDPAPWWPPAPGWWILAGTLLLVLAALWRWWPTAYRVRAGIDALYRRLFRPAWQRAASRELRQLRESARQRTAPELAAASSALIRRIAMARHGRAACASLHGHAWLEWLSAHDPAGFNWGREAGWLLRAPFAPPDMAISQRSPEMAPQPSSQLAPNPRPEATLAQSLKPEPTPAQIEQLIAAVECWVSQPVRARAEPAPAADRARTPLG